MVFSRGRQGRQRVAAGIPTFEGGSGSGPPPTGSTSREVPASWTQKNSSYYPSREFPGWKRPSQRAEKLFESPPLPAEDKWLRIRPILDFKERERREAASSEVSSKHLTERRGVTALSVWTGLPKWACGGVFTRENAGKGFGIGIHLHGESFSIEGCNRS